MRAPDQNFPNPQSLIAMIIDLLPYTALFHLYNSQFVCQYSIALLYYNTLMHNSLALINIFIKHHTFYCYIVKKNRL